MSLVKEADEASDDFHLEADGVVVVVDDLAASEVEVLADEVQVVNDRKSCSSDIFVYGIVSFISTL